MPGLEHDITESKLLRDVEYCTKNSPCCSVSNCMENRKQYHFLIMRALTKYSIAPFSSNYVTDNEALLGTTIKYYPYFSPVKHPTWRRLVSVDEVETSALHRLADGTGYPCLHPAPPVNWNVGVVADTEAITRSTDHSSLCPPYRRLRQHLLDLLLAALVLYMVRTQKHTHQRKPVVSTAHMTTMLYPLP